MFTTSFQYIKIHLTQFYNKKMLDILKHFFFYLHSLKCFNNNIFSQFKNNMEFVCTISNVVTKTQHNYFMIVEFKDGNVKTKYRTEVCYLTNRPKFTNNVFKFIIQDIGSVKFGLMRSVGDSQEDIKNSELYAGSSIKVERKRLRQLPNHQMNLQMTLSHKNEELGRFSLEIKATGKGTNEEGQPYNPLMSRVLYNPQIKDPISIKHHLKTLDKQLKTLHQQYHKIKQQQQNWEKMYYQLTRDEENLKDQIFMLETINSKIQNKIESRQSLQELKTFITLMKDSQNGRDLMLEKIQYFEDRIFREEEQNQQLNIKYNKMKPFLENNILKAQEFAQKLKAKEQQQFQIENNQQKLKSYEQTLYEFLCNQETIQSLSKMAKKSQYTANQAALFLSQVKYQVKLAQYGLLQDQKQDKLLKQIEKDSAKVYQKINEEEEAVYKIKLEALEKEITAVKNKIKRLN